MFIPTEEKTRLRATPVEPQPLGKTGVLIDNLGTPDSPSVPDVRKYLREFLMDGRVLDVPFLSRFLLVNLVIAPFRAPKSAKTYRELWTENGSPLKFYGHRVEKLLQEALGGAYAVKLAMRYQNPSIPDALAGFRTQGFSRIVVIPFFPQYASASSGSVYEKVMEIIKEWPIVPEIRFVNRFLDHPKFLAGFVEAGRKHLAAAPYDHFLFTYHGLPERQIRRGDPTNTCLQGNCCATRHAQNQHCYRAQCFETTRLLAKELGLREEDYTVSFQSRLGRTPWIKPYTDAVIRELVAKGKKRVLAFSPSFVSDCLATTIEIGSEYKELFESIGGEHWQLVESLNDNPVWVETLVDLVKNG
ncbi:MAG: ferrochelatase [Ferruginibacter sp.]|nr:ferrochelatase [Cytophagales bacterium]